MSEKNLSPPKVKKIRMIMKMILLVFSTAFLRLGFKLPRHRYRPGGAQPYKT
jgi:hypothetical protein